MGTNGNGNAPKGTFFARGWLMVGIAFVVAIVTQGFGLYSLSMIRGALGEVLGATATQMSLCWTFYVLALAFVGLFVGNFIDKFGIRASLIVAAVLFAGGFVMVSFSISLAFLYLSYIVMGAGSAFGGVIIITGIPANWFVKKRGLANGFIWSATFFGSLFVSNFCAAIISAGDWHVAVWALAAIAFAVLFAASFILKWRPQDVGLYPDGITEEEMSQVSAELAGSARVVGLTRAEALKSPTFWILFAGIFFIGIGEMGPFQNMTTFIVSRGNDLATAAMFMSLIGTVGFFGKVLSGWVIDKIGARNAFAIIMALAIAGLVMLMFSSADSGMLYMYIAVALFGVSENASIVCFSASTGKFLGAKHYAQIFGVIFVAKALGDSVGAPLLAAVSATALGWTGSFGIAAAVCAISAIIFWFAKKDKKLEQLEQDAMRELQAETR